MDGAGQDNDGYDTNICEMFNAQVPSDTGNVIRNSECDGMWLYFGDAT